MRTELFVSSSPRMEPDREGLGVVVGESFELVATAGPYVLRSYRMYGDKEHQNKTLQAALDAFKQVKVRIE